MGTQGHRKNSAGTQGEGEVKAEPAGASLDLAGCVPTQCVPPHPHILNAQPDEGNVTTSSWVLEPLPSVPGHRTAG